MAEDGRGGRGRAIATIVAVALLVGLIGGLLAWRFSPRAQQGGPDKAWAERVRQVEAVDAAKAAVEMRAPDAQSIAFGEVKVNMVGGEPAVCGAVDLVEPMDSFEGAERFVWVSGQVTLEQQDGTDAVNRQWDAVCKSF